MKKLDILGLGEVVIDWVFQLPYFPSPDEKVDAFSENLFSGGVTANYLVAVSRLGVKCGFIGAVGDDEYGDLLLKDFQKEKIDTKHTLKKNHKKTPVNCILVAKGEKKIIQSPNMKKTKLELSDLDEEYISNAKLLHTTVIHPKIAKKAIAIAKNNNVRISIDLESQIAERGWQKLKDILLEADILLPNKEGAKTITGASTPEKAAKILIEKGIPLVLTTLGKEGVLITARNLQKTVPTFPIDNITDTTGAGDTFNGAFSVSHWIKKWNIEKACKFANAAAALKIQKLGARSGMPNEDDVLEFLRKNHSYEFQ
jgi:ribokinase